jgi:hypothetical protein
VRQPRTVADISAPVGVVRTNKIDKQLQTKQKITPKVSSRLAGVGRAVQVVFQTARSGSAWTRILNYPRIRFRIDPNLNYPWIRFRMDPRLNYPWIRFCMDPHSNYLWIRFFTDLHSNYPWIQLHMDPHSNYPWIRFRKDPHSNHPWIRFRVDLHSNYPWIRFCVNPHSNYPWIRIQQCLLRNKIKMCEIISATGSFSLDRNQWRRKPWVESCPICYDIFYNLANDIGYWLSWSMKNMCEK